MLTLSPAGTLTELSARTGDVVRALHRVIDCPAVERIRLVNAVDVWTGGEGLFSDRPTLNLYASAVIAALDPDMVGVVPVGAVVFAKTRRGAAVSLDGDTRKMISHLVRALLGFADYVRERPVMRAAAVVSGRAWEWTFHGVHFQAIALNGSPAVTLRFRTNVSSEWTVSHQRVTAGRSAKVIAEEMFRDTTAGLP
jgi:hypothetical protein